MPLSLRLKAEPLGEQQADALRRPRLRARGSARVESLNRLFLCVSTLNIVVSPRNIWHAIFYQKCYKLAREDSMTFFRPAILIAASICFNFWISGAEAASGVTLCRCRHEKSIFKSSHQVRTAGGEIKSYQGHKSHIESVSTAGICRRVPTVIGGLLCRQNKKRNAGDTSTVYMDVLLFKIIFDPVDYDGRWYDDPGIIIFMNNDQPLYAHDDRGQTTGGAARCKYSATFNRREPFVIPK